MFLIWSKRQGLVELVTCVFFEFTGFEFEIGTLQGYLARLNVVN